MRVFFTLVNTFRLKSTFHSLQTALIQPTEWKTIHLGFPAQAADPHTWRLRLPSAERAHPPQNFSFITACLEFTIIHSKLWDAVSVSYHYLGYMTVSPNQTLLVFQEVCKHLSGATNVSTLSRGVLATVGTSVLGTRSGSRYLCSLSFAEARHCTQLETILLDFFLDVMIRLSLFYRA